MNPEPPIALYLMSAKGRAVLQCLLAEFGPQLISHVVIGRDAAVADDYHVEIEDMARSAGLRTYSRQEAPASNAACLFAVSWRWLLPEQPGQKLVVFHDSLLPRYRGFAPLVSALVNGDDQLGVTALLASAEYDRGPILGQERIRVTYPLRIADAIEAITPCYQRLAIDVSRRVQTGTLAAQPQDESAATYSLWRDNDDYAIDWTWDAARIERFVDAVGFPYLGASTVARGRAFRILECRAEADVTIENRAPGKVIFVRDGKPVVVCGRGLLAVRRMIDATTGADALPLGQFRTRFGPAQP